MKTYNFLNYLIWVVLIGSSMAGMVACSDNLPLGSDKPEIIVDSFTIPGSIVIPEMASTSTRGDLGEMANDGLKLTVFEFDLTVGHPEMSFLSNIYHTDLNSNTGVTNGGLVNFNLTLKTSEKAKVLHFFVADNSLTSQYGSVADILPALTVGNNKEAYWGYVEFSDGYIKVNEDGKPVLVEGNPILRDDIAGKLKNIPVIRNFAQISVEVAEEVTDKDDFLFLGFEVINVPTSGTIAPWDRERQDIPDLLKGKTMKSYSEITYQGVVSAQAQFMNTENEAKNWDKDDDNMHEWIWGNCYLYEHPYESTRRSYIIVKGIYTEFNEETGDVTQHLGYYKLDIGQSIRHKNEDGDLLDPNDPSNEDDLSDPTMFKQYNIIRNIHYKVVITGVAGEGAGSVEEAINRAPFNNISAATETASMLNISDGDNQLFVNATNHIIITGDQTIDILYRYRTGINDMDGPTNNNDIPFPLGLKVGPVIKSFRDKDNAGNPLTIIQNNVEWRKIEITPNMPTDIVKTQSIAIVDGNGLGRTINLTLREPWQYAPIIDPKDGKEYEATIANGDNNLYDADNPAPKIISSKNGQPLTVYFNLPDGLPETMFPLEFQIESKHQWIENNKIGNLIVTSGPSLFDPNVTAISYKKTVSYQEYIHLYLNDGSNNLDVASTNVNHTVRCRFLTIAEAEGDAEIRIHNPYFNPDATVVFERKESADIML